MRRTLPWFILCAALITWWTFLPPPSAWLDRVYGGVIYPAIAAVLVPLTGSLPLPVTALLLAALLVWLILSVAFKNRRRGASAFWRWLWRGAVGAVTLYALFIVLWGANYGKTPLETRLGLSIDTPTPAETIALAETLGALLRRGDEAPEAWATDLNAGKASLKRVAEKLEQHPVTLPRFVKHTPPGFLIFTGRATGVTVPWTLEAYIDRALPYPVALATALHEAAHVAGYAGEAEADFMAALAGLTAENASVRYGAALVLFLRVGQALPPERYEALFKALPARTRADITAYSRAYTRYLAPDFVTPLQTYFYDRYLRTQRVRAGIADYDRVVVLLLAAQRDGLLTFAPKGVHFNFPEGRIAPTGPG